MNEVPINPPRSSIPRDSSTNDSPIVNESALRSCECWKLEGDLGTIVWELKAWMYD